MKIILRNTRLEFQSGSFDVDEYIDRQTTIQNPEFKSVITDADGKILWGRYTDDSTTDIDLTGMTIDGVSVEKIVDAIILKYDL
jgi:hypothetical protein